VLAAFAAATPRGIWEAGVGRRFLSLTSWRGFESMSPDLAPPSVTESAFVRGFHDRSLRYARTVPRWPAGEAPTGEELLAALFRTVRSEEHTSELQSRGHLVCRLLLEKKKRPARTSHVSV